MTGISTSCGACKFLRRKCTSDCVFAPYFRYELAPQHFAAVHKVFGASNASRLLLHLPEQCRSEAAIAMSFEALARMHDPVYGCVAYIYALQQKVAELQEEVQNLSNQVANLPSNNINTNNPSNIGLEIFAPPLTNVVEMQEEYAIISDQLEEKWIGISESTMSNGNWSLEDVVDDVNMMTSQAPEYWQEECGHHQGVSELSPFETTPFEGMMISEDVFSSYQLPFLP